MDQLNPKNMIVLAIESSCDETACAVVQQKDDKIQVLSNVISSQIGIHQKTCGVVPEVAARAHVEKVQIVFERALLEAKVSIDDIDAIAVTKGPGLMTSLAVGTSFASSLSLIYKKPLIPTNHIHGHIYSNWLDQDSSKIQTPVMVLTVSGGHNELVLIKDDPFLKTGWNNLKLLGKTRDDAAGEAFDKVAKMLGIGYPGGPIISKIAEQGNPQAFDFPRPMKNRKNYDFSFSGLKTAVKLKIAELSRDGQLNERKTADIAASFQEATCDILSYKLLRAAEEFGVKEIHLTGGVSANTRLRQVISEKSKSKYTFRHPSKLSYCTDNAAMIGGAAFFVPKEDWLKPGEALEPGYKK